MTRVRALFALVTLGTGLGGMPWALAALGRWPISGWPSGEQLRDIGDAVVSDTAVFGVLTLAAWVVWLLFVASFLVETRAAVRGLQAPALALAGPVQRTVRFLVAAVIVGVTIHQSSPPATALQLPTPAPAAVAPVVEPASLRSTPSMPSSDPFLESHDAPTVAPVVVTVVPGDSAWSLADVHLGDGMRWRDLWEANRHIVQPDGRTWSDPQLIRAGWRLELPSSPERPASSNGAPHVVSRGDTLSSIAAEELGSPRRYPEIFDLNDGAVQPDGRRLEDPNLIVPGWALDLPAKTPVEPSSQTPTDALEAALVPPPPQADPQTAPPPPSTAPEPSTTTMSVPPLPAAPLVEEGADGPSNEGASSSDWSVAAATLAGVSGALAAGLAVRTGMLRRRRSVRGARSQVPLTEALADTEAAIAAASDVPLIRWAGHHIARLTAQVDRRNLSAGPVAVEISEVSGIEVLWEAPQPDAPRPWRTADGGWAWRLPYDPDADVPPADLPCSVPALVTFGERDGRQFLVDLEAYGSVTVGGAVEQVDAFLRSIAVELASSGDLADACVLSVGLDTGIQHLDRLATTSADDAGVVLERAAQSVGAALDAARVSGTFAARVESSVPVEATVAVIGGLDPADVERLIELCPIRRGVAVVAAGTEGIAGAHVEIGADGAALLSPLGIEFVAAGVPRDTLHAVDELLATLVAEPEVPPVDDVDIRDLERVESGPPSGKDPERTALLVSAPSNGHDAGTTPAADLPLTPQSVEQAARLLVRVLGTPSIPDRAELGRRELILTVYLACREGPVAASAVQDALWGGKPVESKTVWNVIGATRRALGDLDDGTPVLPAADRSRGGTLQLTPGVCTDLALFRELVAQAGAVSSSEAIELLREALALVTGPPFDAVGYDWAYRDQVVAEATTLLEQTTEQLVDLALDARQVGVAREAIVRGLRGLPGNEELYRCRMRVEHHAGNLAGVTAAYEELVTYLTDLETEPSPATAGLLHDLVRPARQR